MSVASRAYPETPVVDPAAVPPRPAGVTPARGRPSWSGLLRLSLVAVPVKAYPAHSSAAAIHFNQLHARCGQRIHYQKRCPVHGPVEAADIVRGYPYAPDQYVLIEPEELDKVRPAKDKALVLEQFLPAFQVDPLFFAGRSLYVLPDGLAAQHPYGVLAEALHKSGRWALGRVVLSSQRHLVLIRPQGRLLVMDVLHYPATLRPAAAWEADLRPSTASAEETHLAAILIDAATSPLDWGRYRDTTTEELTALIEAKVAGQPLPTASAEPRAVILLLDALKQSVAAVQDKTEPVKATTRKQRSSKRSSK